MEVLDLHMQISTRAAEIANNELSKRGIIESVFRADPRRSQRGGLTLSVDEMKWDSLSKRKQKEYRGIGKRAMHEAIVEFKDEFVGLIIGDAREGKNYFERFIAPEEQVKLF